MTLSGKKIFVSREESKADDFSKPLENLGAQVYAIPLIQFEKWNRDDHQDILLHLENFEWIVFTSANGVHFFFEALKDHRVNTESISTKFSVVGRKTEAVLNEYGFQASFMPDVFDAKHFGEQFTQIKPKPKNVLLVKGNLSREIIDQYLSASNISYQSLFVYRTLTNIDVAHDFHELIEQDLIDAWVFTSPSSIQAFIELIESQTTDIFYKPCFCIGETTLKMAVEVGFNKTYTPNEYTLNGLAEQVIDYFLKGDS